MRILRPNEKRCKLVGRRKAFPAIPHSENVQSGGPARLQTIYELAQMSMDPITIVIKDKKGSIASALSNQKRKSLLVWQRKVKFLQTLKKMLSMILVDEISSGKTMQIP
ncbi:hypothetical protein SUGI_0172820 [Cryptomeria japonica]|nr:hypothetical protein SUGI_0172820 [Cryptomeria japonica]